MPAKTARQSAPPTTIPNPQPTSKYTNKDGSKFITIPKSTSSSGSSETSPTMASINTKANGTSPNLSSMPATTAPTVNRKKQKRRQKQAEQAARLAASLSADYEATHDKSLGSDTPSSLADISQKGRTGGGDRDTQQLESDSDGDDYAFEASNDALNSPTTGYPSRTPNLPAKSAKRKGKRTNSQNKTFESTFANQTLSPKPVMSKEKIWNTSSQEERERIKVFWLSLGEEERRSLVKVEKDAVLKKMKEQQKHSCSCTVCGRKRIAIEEELEVLYDAYYEELEQYANNQHDGRPPPLMAGSRRFGALTGLAPPSRIPPPFTGQHPSRGRIVEHFGDDEEYEDDGDEEYSEDDGDDGSYLDDEEPMDDIPRTHATDFFNFGQSLTVQGGILTVADDLLKNDGKKFIEMMEQLAERRMAREEDAKEQYNMNGYAHPNGTLGHHHSHHNHPPVPDDDLDYEEDEEDDEDYDSQDEDYDDEEMDTMTEEQRMEEGRRMFQIFAARMFEQRVLTAYKEKVAAERQQKLLQELEEEDEAQLAKKAKKAREAQKKKEKAQSKKLALAEEKARREAEKAAEEAARLAEEAKKAEEARKRAEEKRKKREAQKKAEEEERLRKEAEKQRRIQEQRERQAEQERKAREAKEREKKAKEEQRRKEKEAKEAKEKEQREHRERLEREKEAEAKAKAERELEDRRRREEQSQQGKRLSQQPPNPSSGGSQSGVTGLPQVNAPTLPQAPTPVRSVISTQREQNGSIPQTPQFGSAKSQSTSPNPSTPLQNSPGPQFISGRTPSQPYLHQPQANSPMHSALKANSSGFLPPLPGMHGMGINGFQPGFPPMAPGFGRMSNEPPFQHPPFGNQMRPFAPNGLSFVPGVSGMPQSRGFPAHYAPPPGFPPQPLSGVTNIPPGFSQSPKEAIHGSSHSRHQSASFDRTPPESTPSLAAAQPIARPTPIGRPGSLAQGRSSDGDVDDLTGHLGSSALLDDSDEPIPPVSTTRRASAAPSSLGRQAGFGISSPYNVDTGAFGSPTSYSNWNPSPFSSGSLPGSGFAAGWGGPLPGGFGAGSGMPQRQTQPRSVAVRLMLCKACKALDGTSVNNYHTISAVKEQIARLNPEISVADQELLELAETEGNSINGGGQFDLKMRPDEEACIRYDLNLGGNQRAVGVPGDIGSPVVGSASVISPLSRFPPGIPAAPGGGF